MSLNASFSQIADVLRANDTFVVVSHIRPDGDALGCQIAMALCLLQLGKKVKVWNEDGMLDRFRFLPGSELVTPPPAEPEEFDVAVILDTAVRERAGTPLQAIKHAKTWVNMDHHVSNNHYGDLAHIDATAPATGQILYEFVRETGMPFTPAMADSIFVAISTDTGSFQYPNTTARTYEIGAELIKAGVNVGELSQKTYESQPRRRIELLRETLTHLEFASGGRAACTALSIADIARAGAKPEDTEGLIDTIRSVEGVIVAAFLEEMEDGKIRISLRSKDKRVDVCQICKLFGGGGHVLAAGARTRGSLDEVKSKVLQAIHDALPS